MIRIRTSLPEDALAGYVAAQANALFPDGRALTADQLRAFMQEAMSRVEHCFIHIGNRYYFDGAGAVFNHLNGDQYTMFLYILARVAHGAGAAADVASKLFLLNKTLHGIDAYFEVELPSIFMFVHPLGTVLGRGRYSDYLLTYQRCGIGANNDIFPELGAYTTLHPGAAVLGKCRIGRNCTIAAESLVIDQDLPDDTVYIGNPRDHLTRQDRAVHPIWRA